MDAYINNQLEQIKIDGYKFAQDESDYYRVAIKFWDYEDNKTNELSITNKEFSQIKEILLKKSS
tara:strand:+ start:682 stop:873 length:192 start_codon:yes stop_codon:yes gene_type:complete